MWIRTISVHKVGSLEVPEEKCVSIFRLTSQNPRIVTKKKWTIYTYTRLSQCHCHSQVLHSDIFRTYMYIHFVCITIVP